MSHETHTNIFNPHTLPIRLREMYERRVLYIEEIITDMRSLSGGSVNEDFIEGVRARHIAHAQQTVEEVAQYATQSAHLNHIITTYGYGEVVANSELPQI